MKKICFRILILFLVFTPFLAYAEDFDYDDLASVPVLHEGRVKPLDTLARHFALAFSGKSKFKNESALRWFVGLVLSPESSFDKRVFSIKNPDVLTSLGITEDNSKLYSFTELLKAIRAQFSSIQSIQQIPQESRTASQNQLVDLYNKVMLTYELSRSLSMYFPELQVVHPSLAKELNVKVGDYTYLELLKQRNLIKEKFDQVKEISPKDWNDYQRNIAILSLQLNRVEDDARSRLFAILPLQWEGEEGLWFSPWAILSDGQGSPLSANYLQLWHSSYLAAQEKDAHRFNSIAKQIQNYPKEHFAEFYSLTKINLELKYNRWDLFTKSLALYILSFLALALSWLAWRKLAERISFACLSLAVLAHLVGLIQRMIIMSRPPVSTLYESIIFVALIASVSGFLLELRKRNTLGILIASLSGTILQFVANSYASDGDTMGMLVAVLNTNFWLATHVVTITIGYGCCFVAGILAHIYLIKRLFGSSRSKDLNDLNGNLLGVNFFALFFAMFGTILGGIWADQSWGRFWGWDPKENGALLIVLWILFLLHGRLAGKMKALGFAVGSVLTNIVVALAWFGVNLLSVGLHSYGFTSNIATNLGIFCASEFIFAFLMLFLIRRKERLAGIS